MTVRGHTPIDLGPRLLRYRPRSTMARRFGLGHGVDCRSRRSGV
ncbi:hypothetical protein PCLA_02f0416 [Pseudomonas citronellolis]|nr:hypothetical protein PCLA_02f0416 [Pseudomonas citronellolis]